MSSNTQGSYRPIDSKREEFRKYLERAGVMDALTKVLVMLYEEADKPQDAMEFVIKNLCADRPEMAELENLRSNVEALQLKVQALEEQKARLKQRLAVYEPVDQDEEEEEEEEDGGGDDEGEEGDVGRTSEQIPPAQVQPEA
ncbi:c-Myc-binding protein [Lycorma delicatula]|uniref:c-Myc-binding protein n=1 Tax=Lycorma delicatula TaxID=130591 RepID=UPI003F513267